MARWPPEQEILADVVAAADLVAADKVRVVGFKVQGADNMAGYDLGTRAGRIGVEDIQHPVGVGLFDVGPVGPLDLPRSVAADCSRDHTHLQPKYVFPGWCATWVHRRRLADNHDGFGRQQSRLGLRVSEVHHPQRRREVDVGEAFQVLSGGPVGQRVHRQMDHHGSGRIAEGQRPVVIAVIAGFVVQQADQCRRAGIGDHRFAGSHGGAVGQPDAVGGAPGADYAGHARTGVNRSVLRFDHFNQGIDQTASAALAEDHAEALVGEGF